MHKNPNELKFIISFMLSCELKSMIVENVFPKY